MRSRWEVAVNATLVGLCVVLTTLTVMGAVYHAGQKKSQMRVARLEQELKSERAFAQRTSDRLVLCLEGRTE